MKTNIKHKTTQMNDGAIIIISSISSTATYIFVDKILKHLEHPMEAIILALGLAVMFICILFFF